MIDIAAIKARADKATAGPWELSPHSIGKGGWISGEHGSYTDIVINAGTDRALTNADFIAHARTDIPALIAALEASEAARVKAEQERDALKAGNARFRSGLNTLANSYYKDDQHQDYARHVLESSK